MGQFYRVILQEYAKTHDVNAYIQNPCMEFWEDTNVAKKSRHRQWNARNGVWQSENGEIPSTVRQKLHYSLNESAGVEVNDDYEEGVNSRNENALLSCGENLDAIISVVVPSRTITILNLKKNR